MQDIGVADKISDRQAHTRTHENKYARTDEPQFYDSHQPALDDNKQYV